MIWQTFLVFFLIGDFVIVQVIPFLTALNSEFFKVFIVDYTNCLITKKSLGHRVHPVQNKENSLNRIIASSDLANSMVLEPQVLPFTDLNWTEEIFVRNGRVGDLRRNREPTDLECSREARC